MRGHAIQVLVAADGARMRDEAEIIDGYRASVCAMSHLARRRERVRALGEQRRTIEEAVTAPRASPEDAAPERWRDSPASSEATT